MRHRLAVGLSVIGVGVTVAVLFALAWPDGEGAVDGAPEGAEHTYRAFRAAVGGVPPRPHAPAVRRGRGAWATGATPGAWANAPVDDPVALGEDDPAWSALLQALAGVAGPTPGSVARHHCAVTHLTGMLDEPCTLDLKLFLERDGTDGGRVAGVEPAEPPPEEGTACAQYVSCAAPTWVGERLPWPEPRAGKARIVVRHRQIVLPSADDPAAWRARVENTLPALHATLEALSGDTPAERAARTQLEDLIAYYTWTLEAMDEAEDRDGG